jgi:hypothetical protein
VSDIAPKSIVGKATFRDETMNMRVPFERTSKGMKNTDKTRDKVFGLVEIMKHTKDNTTDCLEEAVEE